MHHAFNTSRIIEICGVATVLAVSCTADMPASKSSAAPLADRPQLDASTAKPSSSRDAGVVTRGAGMPIVPIHRVDAGSKAAPDAAAEMAAAKPPAMIVATPDAGRDAGTDAATHARDAGRAMMPEVDPQLPRPIHRYSFSGSGDAAHDEHGGADAIVEGNAQLDGQGAVSFPGQGYGVVTLPDGFLNGLTSFTVLLWLETRSQACWQRAIDLLDVHQDSNQDPPERSSLYLTPYGCPDALPTLGYVDSTSRYHLISQTEITQSELVQLGMSFSSRSRTLRLIVNGVVEREQSVPVDVRAVQRAQPWLGRSHVEQDPPLHGSISELRVYDSALEDSALRELYERGPDVSP